MKVTVVSYLQFKDILINNGINGDNVELFPSTIFISIIDSKNTNSVFKTPFFYKDYSNVLNLQFDDVTQDGENSPTADGETKAFTGVEAKKIINFLDKNKEAKFCLIHCAAGISRSGAVGQFVNDYFGGNHQDFIRRNPQILPNVKISRMLNNEMR